MPSAIIETASKGDAINAPVGADPRTAASVRTPFQAVGNRLKFLENFYDSIKVFLLGGAASLVDNLVYTIVGSKILEINGTPGISAVKITNPYLRVDGNVLGHLFSPGLEGCASRKTIYVANGTGALNVDPEFYDTVVIDSGISGPRQVILQSSAPGAHIKVVNLATAFSCNLQRPSGGGQIGPDVRFAAGDAFVVEALCCPDAVWRLTGYQPFTL